MLNIITLGYVKARIAVSSFIHDKRGVTAIEYAIVAVAVAAIVAAVFGTNGTLRTALDTAMNQVSSTITSFSTTTGGGGTGN